MPLLKRSTSFRCLRSVSLFACDEFAVYSNVSVQLTRDVWTNAVPISLQCKYGGEFKTALNNDIFMAVWKKVVADGRYNFHDWTVKVDADSVFIPGRLRLLLADVKEQPRGVYLANCKLGLHGPLEVLSRMAVNVWYVGMPTCVQHFLSLCSGDCLWGEDMFIDQCLMKVLQVQRLRMFGMLIEDHCEPPRGWRSCTNTSAVAFHPFKIEAEYGQCLVRMQATPYIPTKPVPSRRPHALGARQGPKAGVEAQAMPAPKLASAGAAAAPAGTPARVQAEAASAAHERPGLRPGRLTGKPLAGKPLPVAASPTVVGKPPVAPAAGVPR